MHEACVPLRFHVHHISPRCVAPQIICVCWSPAVRWHERHARHARRENVKTGCANTFQYPGGTYVSGQTGLTLASCQYVSFRNGLLKSGVVPGELGMHSSCVRQKTLRRTRYRLRSWFAQCRSWLRRQGIANHIIFRVLQWG